MREASAKVRTQRLVLLLCRCAAPAAAQSAVMCALLLQRCLHCQWDAAVCAVVMHCAVVMTALLQRQRCCLRCDLLLCWWGVGVCCAAQGSVVGGTRWVR